MNRYRIIAQVQRLDDQGEPVATSRLFFGTVDMAPEIESDADLRALAAVDLLYSVKAHAVEALASVVAK